MKLEHYLSNCKNVYCHVTACLKEDMQHTHTQNVTSDLKLLQLFVQCVVLHLSCSWDIPDRLAIPYEYVDVCSHYN